MISWSAKVELGFTALEVPQCLEIRRNQSGKIRAPVANRRPSERRIYKENQCRLIKEQFEDRISVFGSAYESDALSCGHVMHGNLYTWRLEGKFASVSWVRVS
jgi:hypothetical protein